MEKKKILICGATGFIGRNIAERFCEREDFEVYGTYFNSTPFNNPKISFIKADLTKHEQVKNAIKGKDIVVQYAAITSGSKDILSKPYIHITDNAVMNSLILREAYEQGIKHLIFPSCLIMYQSNEQPLKEEDFNPNQEILKQYFGAGWTKVYIEKMCEFFSRLERTKHTVIRQANIYGPYDKFDLERSHVFGATMTKIMNASDNGTINVWGAGEEKRDLLYVSDLVDFIELAIDNQTAPYALYNLGSGQGVSVKELVKKIIAVSGKNLDINYDLSKPTIKINLCVDATKAKSELGWQPKMSLNEGIKKTMEWYNQNIAK